MSQRDDKPAESSPTTRDRAQRAVPFAALSGLFRVVFSLLSMLLLVRYLPADEYGSWILLIGLTTPIGIFMSVGHSHALLRFLPGCTSAEERRHLVWNVSMRRGVAIVLASAILLVGFPIVSEFLGIGDRFWLFVLLLPAVVCASVGEYTLVALDSAFRQNDVLRVQLGSQSLLVGLVVAGIAREESLPYFAIAFSACWTLQLCASTALCIRAYGAPRVSDIFRVPESAANRRYRLISYVDDIGMSLLSTEMTRYLIALVSSRVEVAIFAIAGTVVSRLRVFQPIEIFRPLASVTFFGRLEEGHDDEEVNRMFHFLFTTNRIVAMLYLTLFLPLGQETVVWVFREEYAGAYWPALFLFVSAGVFGMPVGIVAKALRRPEVMLYSKVTVLLNLALGIPLALEHGAAGLAFSTMVSNATRNLLTFALLRRGFPLRLPIASTLRFLLAGALSVAAIAWLPTELHLLLRGLLGVVIYAVAIRMVGAVRKDERRLLLEILPQRLRGPARIIVGT